MKEEIKLLHFRGYDYEVSNLGIVYRNGKELRQNTNAEGYLVVSVPNNRTVAVHIFVALAFVYNDNPDVKVEVNHIDFNRQNNNFSNLEWLSHADNVRYSFKHGRYPDFSGKNNPNYGNRKLSEFYKNNPDVALEKQSRKGDRNGRCQPIIMYKDGEFIKEFKYIGLCAEYLKHKYGYNSSINAIRDGITKSINRNGNYKGFTFKRI